jgi:hypothetical protein
VVEYAKNGLLNSLMNIWQLLRADQIWALTQTCAEIQMEQETLFGVSQVILKRDGNIVMRLRKEALRDSGVRKAPGIGELRQKLGLD